MGELELGDPEYVGDYEIDSRLGSGSMGVVYKGWNRAGTLVAVKVISRHLVQEERYRQRFLMEAEAAQSVPKFCTAQVLDSSMTGDQPFIVTEYVAGNSLDDEVAGGTAGGSALDSLAVGIAAALTAIHGAGVVHRDLKPSNILLSPWGPRVIDFGLASILDAARLTSSGKAVGTIAFMAPEQAAGDAADPKADLFSWAATIVFAATGQPPCRSTSKHNYSVKYDEEFLAGSIVLRDMVGRCLDLDPHARPTSAELLDALASLAPSTLASAVDHEAKRRLASRPRTADQWAAKARESLASERFRLALFNAEQGILIDPQHAKCWLHKGIAQSHLGRAEEGEDSMQLAYEMDSNDPEILAQYSSALTRSPREENRVVGFSISPNLLSVRKAFIEYLLSQDDDALWAKSVQLTQDSEVIDLYSNRFIRKAGRIRRERDTAKRAAQIAKLSLSEMRRRPHSSSHIQEAQEHADEAQRQLEDATDRLLRTTSEAYIVVPHDSRVRQAHGLLMLQEGDNARDLVYGFELARESEEALDQLVLRCLRHSAPGFFREVFSAIELSNADIMRISGLLSELRFSEAAPLSTMWETTPEELTSRGLRIEALAELCQKRLQIMPDSGTTGLQAQVHLAHSEAFSAFDDSSIRRGLNTLGVVSIGLLAIFGILLLAISLATSSSVAWPTIMLIFPIVAAASFSIGAYYSPDRRRMRRRKRMLATTAVESPSAPSPPISDSLSQPTRSKYSPEPMVVESRQNNGSSGYGVQVRALTADAIRVVSLR